MKTAPISGKMPVWELSGGQKFVTSDSEFISIQVWVSSKGSASLGDAGKGFFVSFHVIQNLVAESLDLESTFHGFA